MVRPDVLQRSAERVVAGARGQRAVVVVPSLMRVPLGGEPDSVADVDVARIGELVLVVHVAQHGIGDPRVDPLEHVLFVDRRVDAELAVDGDRDHGDFFRD